MPETLCMRSAIVPRIAAGHDAVRDPHRGLSFAR